MKVRVLVPVYVPGRTPQVQDGQGKPQTVDAVFKAGEIVERDDSVAKASPWAFEPLEPEENRD